jgi:hypothetical protein
MMRVSGDTGKLAGIHTITLAPDGVWLAIDTHGNARCSVAGLRKTQRSLILRPKECV